MIFYIFFKIFLQIYAACSNFNDLVLLLLFLLFFPIMYTIDIVKRGSA